MRASIYSAFVLAFTASLAAGFAPVAPLSQVSKKVNIPVSSAGQFKVSHREELFIAKATTDGEGDDVPGFSINAPYALAYVAFLGFAYLRQTAEVEGTSMEIIQQFIANPLNPGMNEAFVTIFNLLGLYFVPMACLLLPGARNQKLPAAPFVLGSMFGGYGVLGLYASTRKSDPSPVTKADLGFVTRNILENKLFNYFICLAFLSAYVTSGAVGALLSDPGQLVQGYLDIFPESAIVSASSFDFLILTVATASFIPEDLERRGYEGGVSKEALLLPLFFFLELGLLCTVHFDPNWRRSEKYKSCRAIIL